VNWKEEYATKGESCGVMCRAYDLAHKAHENQTRKDGKTPYIVHPQRVMEKLWGMWKRGDDRINHNIICMAWLHDVLEDCPWVSEREIAEATSEYILEGVKDLTNPSKKFKPTREQLQLHRGSIRKIKKQMDRDHIKLLPWDRKVVKLADRLDNVMDMSGMHRDFCLLYAEESLALLDVLRGTHHWLEKTLEKAIEDLKKR
jgi:(p)ppGpp synthase/HD superfamily hydrolase